MTESKKKFKNDNEPLFVFSHNIFNDPAVRDRFRSEVYAVNDYFKSIETSKFQEEMHSKVLDATDGSIEDIEGGLQEEDSDSSDDNEDIKKKVIVKPLSATKARPRNKYYGGV